MQPYEKLSSEQLEVSSDEFYEPNTMFPVRPEWDFSISKQQLEQNEEKYFKVSIYSRLYYKCRGYHCLLISPFGN